MCTAYGDLLAVACRHRVNVWQNPEQSPGFPEELEDISRMELLLGTTHTPKEMDRKSNGRILIPITRYTLKQGSCKNLKLCPSGGKNPPTKFSFRTGFEENHFRNLR